jgi:hypothetical protein
MSGIARLVNRQRKAESRPNIIADQVLWLGLDHVEVEAQ